MAFQYPLSVLLLTLLPFRYLDSFLQKKYLSCSSSPGRSHGLYLQMLKMSGMMEAGSGDDEILDLRYWKTSSSSVGWNRKPGGSLMIPFSLTNWNLFIFD